MYMRDKHQQCWMLLLLMYFLNNIHTGIWMMMDMQNPILLLLRNKVRRFYGLLRDGTQMVFVLMTKVKSFVWNQLNTILSMGSFQIQMVGFMILVSVIFLV